MSRENCVYTIPILNGPSDLSAGQMTLSWRGWLEDGRRLVLRELGHVWDTLKVWRHRQVSRRHLACLDARLLRDIALTADEARRIARKPFWKA